MVMFAGYGMMENTQYADSGVLTVIIWELKCTFYAFSVEINQCKDNSFQRKHFCDDDKTCFPCGSECV